MAHKDDLKKEAESLGIVLEGTESVAKLEELISDYKDVPPAVPNVAQKEQSKETMVPLSEVKKLIAEAMAAQSEKDKPVKVKKVTEHHAHVFRLNGKWIVDFADHNYDYDHLNEDGSKGKFIDPYIKEKIHAYNVYNPQKREYEAWIDLIFQDGSRESIQLNRYVERRTLVYCKIEKREQVDASYVIGEVEKKKEGKDGVNVGTGVMIDQEVTMHHEVFYVTTPDGESLILPEHVVC